MATLKLLRFAQHTTTQLRNLQPQIRHASYKASSFVVDLGEIKTNYEISRDPNEWKFVEDILPRPVIPDPKPKSEYPSGWQPPADNLAERPYYVERTKNHMIPVFMSTTYRDTRRLTYVKKIKGDIWQLHQELTEFLQKETIKPIRSQVNEFAGYLCYHGDHVNAIKYFLTRKGY